jgi:hypothetical protein
MVRVCDICKSEIREYHVKIDGKYYHYSPCSIEKFKRGQVGSVHRYSSDGFENLFDDEYKEESALLVSADTCEVKA